MCDMKFADVVSRTSSNTSANTPSAFGLSAAGAPCASVVAPPVPNILANEEKKLADASALLVRSR